MSEVQFIDGLSAKKPHENAPDFVKASVSIHVPRLREFLSQQSGEWLNADLKESKGGKWYIAVNDYQSKQTDRSVETTGFNPPITTPAAPEDDLPF